MSTSMNQVMTSATVGLKASFCDNIGMKYMDEKEPKFDKMPSSFDFTKSPIIYYPKYSMGWKYKDSSFPKLKEMTYQIIRQFKDFKGIIQTGTYENAKSIYNDAPKDIRDRLILYNNSTEKAVGIDWHRSRKDSVIIGPTLNEGVDLPGDLCRFIIILKVPYPNLKDDLVKAKMELFPLWYTSEASNQIIQGIRNNTDVK
jgi:Rad3-related DNA helicase